MTNRTVAGVVLLCAPGWAFAQNTSLPALAPTAQAAPVQAGQSKPAAQGSSTQDTGLPPARRARVTYTQGLLGVQADDSSLNQILRDISRQTGMTIVGGVVDERVFGTYGPADPGTLLSKLLSGTGSNMLLIEDERQAPRQLVLSARQGGVTPPSPNQMPHTEDDDTPPQLAPHVDNRHPDQPPVQPFDPTRQLNPPAAPAQATPDPGAATEQSPNGVKTPQQIYEQLLKLQQSKQTPQ